VHVRVESQHALVVDGRERPVGIVHLHDLLRIGAA
jgi:CBS domain-containing protein